MKRSWRSLLFVPANDPRKLEKVASRGADAVIIDLEDGVLADCKVQARESLPGTIDMLASEAIDIVVRINHSWLDAFADLHVVVREGVAAIMVPKVDDPARVAVTGKIVAELAQRRACGAPGMIALIESPAGVAEAHSIAAVAGVSGLALGTEDFALSMGIRPEPECLQLPCQLIAMAAVRYGIAALGMPISIAMMGFEEEWRSAAASAQKLGMTGALCIHPKQVEAVNTAFGASVRDRLDAAALLAAWRDAGCPGVFKFKGRMIDRPVLLAAQRVDAAGDDR